ncbi:MAG TPA: cytochrome oxidase small assembly protein [Rubrivivax sp.]|nr:cytochrome oxidase small assembly protein [Rubrivivax sp.]
MVSDAQRKANLKTAWILAALAALFGVGFFVRIVVLGG